MSSFDTQLLIGSTFEPGQDVAEPVLNPRTGALILDVPEASLSQVDRAVAAARWAFPVKIRIGRRMSILAKKDGNFSRF